MAQVSVVIPVYNVEQHIERCLHSLFNQTLKDIEYLFVDDCSTDDSVGKIYKVLETYPNRKTHTRILRHGINRGVGAARATGIQAATGDYIIHCDPDDYVELDIYERLYNKAVTENVDIVACYFWMEYHGESEIICKKYDSSPQSCLKNIYKKNKHSGALYDKLVRRELIINHDIFPYEGCNYAEDFYCVIKIFYYAHSLAVVKRPLYHYCRREDSITMAPKNEYYWNVRRNVTDRICEFLRGKKIYETACCQMRFYIKMEYKSVFIGKEKEWFELYRESHDKIFKYNDMPLKGRIIWWLALRSYFTYKIAKALVRGM